jgi:hypothetical protein
MALEELLQDLTKLHGYLGSAILNANGEVVVSDSASAALDFGTLTRTLSDILTGMHEAAAAVGFRKGHEIAVQTGGGVLLLHCNGGAGQAHMHVICLLRPEGNQALAKMALHKIVPRLAP